MSAVDDIRSALMSLQVPEEFDSALRLLVDLKEIYEEMGIFVTEFGKATYDMKPDDFVKAIVNGREIKPDASSSRKKWDHNALTNIVLDRLIDMNRDEETGEITISPRALVEEFRRFAHTDYWVGKSLETLGINPDMYSEKEEPKPVLKVGSRKN